MQVVHLATHDNYGGAARAAYRLHEGLRLRGHRSSMLVSQRHSDDPDVRTLEYSRALPDRIARRLRRERIQRDLARYAGSRPPAPEYFSDDRAPGGRELVRAIGEADVVTLHWVAGFLDYTAFFAGAAPRYPLVWLLHDMNPLTGGCHYDGGCERHRSGCGSCPQLGSDRDADLSARIWRRKRDAFARLAPDALQLVAPSRWLAEQMRRSPLLGRFPIEVIPYGLDLQRFAPRDKGYARQVLGIPADARVILFVAAELNSVRKGFGLLTEALRELEVPNAFLVSLGDKQPPLPSGLPHRQIRAVNDDRLLSLIYSAADVFVAPSLQDNFPNTVLEALACGTPVIAFRSGGIEQMIEPDATGHLVPTGDVGALRAALESFFAADNAHARMSEECRAVAEREYDILRQATRHEELYQGLLERRRSRNGAGSN